MSAISYDRALYAGSFDPLTYGHLELVRRGARLYRHLTVAIGDNPRKRYMFSTSERAAMVRDETHGYANVDVIVFDGLLVHQARELGCGVILRGLRAVTDFEFEFQLGLANMDLASEVETVFLLTGPQNIFVSSSTVKEIAQGGGPIARYVPPGVAEKLYARVREA